MKQTSFFKPNRKEHGGILSLNSRRSRRPLSTKHPVHFTLRSDFAYGARSLLKHQALINHIGKKFAHRFGVRIYRQAICGNHLHLLIRGTTRVGLQNFFRVFAGHIAQQILGTAPITEIERSKVLFKAGGAPKFEAQFLEKTPIRRSEQNDSTQPKASQVKTSCKKNQRKFWDLLTYTRLISWGKEFTTVSGYLVQNTLEALQLIAYQPRKKRQKGRNDCRKKYSFELIL